MKHGVYVYENASDTDDEVVVSESSGSGSRRKSATAQYGIKSIIFNPDDYTLKFVMDDGREFITGSIRGEKGEQGDGYNPDVITGLQEYADDAVAAQHLDTEAAVGLLVNEVRQVRWDLPQCETGSATLTNTMEFPFNNSKVTVALATSQADTNYAVIASIESAVGNAGEVVVSEKQTNGFKLAYTGSAKSAVVNYIVIGGIIK